MIKNTEKPHKQLGDLLTALRQRAGIAQQSDLAAMVKVTQQTVSRWELGRSRPRDSQIPSIAKALSTDANRR